MPLFYKVTTQFSNKDPWSFVLKCDRFEEITKECILAIVQRKHKIKRRRDIRYIKTPLSHEQYATSALEKYSTKKPEQPSVEAFFLKKLLEFQTKNYQQNTPLT